MEKTNTKTITMSYAILAALIGFSVSMLLKSFAGAFGVVARLVDSDLVRHGLPVGIGLLTFALLQFNPKVVAWSEDVVSEIGKVIWPSQKEVTGMTVVVVIMVIISTVIVTAFDFASSSILQILMDVVG